jgi:hypothetical protein
MVNEFCRAGVAGRHRLSMIVVALALAIGTSVLIEAKVRINTQKDETFSFRGLHTWSWHPEGVGDVKMALTPDDNPEAVRTRFEPVIKDAVERSLTERGLTMAPAGQTPDLHVIYYLLISTDMNRQTMGQFVPAATAWQLAPFPGATQSLKVIEQGSLVLDVNAAASRSLVWRGVAQAELHRQRTPAERETRLRAVIGDLFKKFPKTT